MPKETVYITEREVKILGVFVEEKILNDQIIAEELEILARKLRG